MSDTRDPRRDPRPGDVVELDGFRYRVDSFDAESGLLRITDTTDPTWVYSLDSYRYMARNATVIHTAPTGPS